MQRCDGAGSRFSTVVVVFHSEKYSLVLTARAKVAAVFPVEKQPVLRLLSLGRKFQPRDIERCFIQIEKTLDHERVIVGEAFDVAATVAVTAIEQLTLSFV